MIQMFVQAGIEVFHVVVFLSAQIQMQHRIVCPILFQLFDGQALEQSLFPLEVGFHGRNQEALAEAARAAQEVIFASGGESVNQIGLIHIKEASLADAFKVLDSNRIKHGWSLLFF